MTRNVWIQKVSGKNIRCYTDFEYDFPLDNFSVVVGKNGAGKSTIFKSIAVSLFGDDGGGQRSNVNSGDMLNRRVGQDGEIVTNFVVQSGSTTDNYEVRMYIKHKKYKDKLFLLQNGIDISRSSKTETQDLIERLILPRDVFHNTVHFNQNVTNFFTDLSNSEQKKIFDTILRLMEYKEFYDRTKKSLDTKQLIVDTTRQQIDALNSQIQTLQQSIERKKLDISNELIRLNNELQQYENEINAWTSALESVNIHALEQYKSKLMSDSIPRINFQIELVQNRIDNATATYQDQLSELQNSILQKLRLCNDEYNNEKQRLLNDLKSNEQKEIQVINLEFDKIRQQYDNDVSHLNQVRDSINRNYTDKIQNNTNNLSQFRSSTMQKISEIENNYLSEMKKFDNTDSLKNLQTLTRDFETFSNELKSSGDVLRQEAAVIDSQIKKLNTEISNDEKSIETDHGSCTKCLRPFQGEDQKNIIRNEIERNKAERTTLSSKIEALRVKMTNLGQKYSAEKEKVSIVTTQLQKLIDQNNEQKTLATQIRDRSIQTHQTQLKQSETDTYNTNASLLKDCSNEIAAVDLELTNLRMAFSKTLADKEKKIKDISLKYSNDPTVFESTNKHEISISKIKSEGSEKERQLLEQFEQSNKTDSLNLQQYLNDLELYESELKKCTSDILNYRSSETQKSNTSIKIDNLKQMIAMKQSDRSIETENQILESITLKRDELNSNVTNINNKIQILSFWKTGFSDSGIKSMLIDVALPYMNQSVMEALEVMVPGMFTVSFDTISFTKSGDAKEQFKVNIRHNIKGTDDQKMLSGGERRLIDLATMHALRKLVEKIYECNIQNTFYDEILDSLDPENSHIVCQSIKNMTQNRNVTLITHSIANMIEPDRVIRV